MGRIWGARARPPRRTRSILAHPTSLIFVPISSPEQTLATLLHSPPLPHHNTKLFSSELRHTPSWQSLDLVRRCLDPRIGSSSLAASRSRWSTALLSNAPGRSAPDRRRDLSGGNSLCRRNGRSDPRRLEARGPSAAPSPARRHMGAAGTGVPDMAEVANVAAIAAVEEAIRARIVKKRQWRNTRVVARE